MGIKTQMQENNAQLQEHYAYIPTMPKSEDVNHGQYTWHRYTVVDGAKGDAIGFVVDDSKTAYPMDGVHTDGFYYVLYGSPIKIVTWSDGTDEEIVAMVEAADNGEINLADYWAVGQQRKVTLSAMSQGTVGESHAQQEATLVLMNVGGKTLSNGKECSFIVGMKNSLQEKGLMAYNNDGLVGWSNCRRRTWCNSTFKNSIPSTILPIFKQFKNLTGKGDGSESGTISTTEWFAFPAEIEVFGKRINSVDGEGTQFQWYKTAANRKKKLGDSGSLSEWWTRSPGLSYLFSYFCSADANGGQAYQYRYTEYGLSPFGCI